MKPCCQQCWADVIVGEDGSHAIFCNDCAIALNKLYVAAREQRAIGMWCSLSLREAIEDLEARGER
jgi:hypothetical protein